MDPTRFQNLNDIQLAILLSLVARNHCLITTDEGHLDQLEKELEKTATNGFGLSTTIIRCTDAITPDEFVSGILVQDPQLQEDTIRPTPPSPVPVPVSSHSSSRHSWKRHTGTTSQSSGDSGDSIDGFFYGKRIVNVVIARDLELAPQNVQTQAIELIRNRAIITKHSTQEAPSAFLLIGLIRKTRTKPNLNVHLADHFFISHYHDSRADEDEENNESSLSSVIIHRAESSSDSNSRPSRTKKTENLLFSAQELEELSELANSSHVSIEIKRYIHDIIVFLRMHRAVAGGISAKGTKDFELVVKCLCPLNGLEYATPSLVELAVYKVYSHRIEVADKTSDRSLMWGSNPEAVEKYLEQVDAGRIIDDVLEEVKAPL